MVDRRVAALVIVFAFGASLLFGRWAVDRARTPSAGGDAAAVQAAATAARPDPSEVWRVPFVGAPSRGPADALASIVIFTDLRAGAGARLEAMVQQLARERPGDVRYSVRLMPSAATQLAVEALSAAHLQGRFFEMRGALGDRAAGELSRRDVEDAAREVRLDPGLLAAALDGGKAAVRARADARLAATLGVTAPTVFVNGQRVVGSVAAAELGRIVARQIARAEALVRRGIARDRIYAELTRDGRTDVLDRGAERTTRRREDPEAVYRVEVGDAPVKGPADALVTIVEFGDFQDPFSKRAARALAELLARHPADVRLAWKDSPMSVHPEARSAAVAARAAGAQGQFWPMHDALFAAQSTLGRETYERLARELRLDLARFTRDLGSDSIGKAVMRERETAAPLGVVATPVFFVNGKRLRGFRSPEALAALVDRELARARAVVADAGGRPADLYERLVRDGALRSVFLPE